jgi:outer membrane biosynthesis protein TonB
MASGSPGIVVYCKKCGKKNRAPVAAVGKRGVCAQCGKQMTIPAESETGPPEELNAPDAPPPAPPEPKPAPPEAPPSEKKAPRPEERPAPKPLPAAEEKPLPLMVERPPVARTPAERDRKKSDDAPLDEALPELDAILKDLDDLLPPPDGKRPAKPAPPACPACGAAVDPAKNACVRCGHRLPASR